MEEEAVEVGLSLSGKHLILGDVWVLSGLLQSTGGIFVQDHP